MEAMALFWARANEDGSLDEILVCFHNFCENPTHGKHYTSIAECLDGFFAAQHEREQREREQERSLVPGITPKEWGVLVASGAPSPDEVEAAYAAVHGEEEGRAARYAAMEARVRARVEAWRDSPEGQAAIAEVQAHRAAATVDTCPEHLCASWELTAEEEDALSELADAGCLPIKEDMRRVAQDLIRAQHEREGRPSRLSMDPVFRRVGHVGQQEEAPVAPEEDWPVDADGWGDVPDDEPAAQERLERLYGDRWEHWVR